MKLNNNAAECLSIYLKFILGFVELDQLVQNLLWGKHIQNMVN